MLNLPACLCVGVCSVKAKSCLRRHVREVHLCNTPTLISQRIAQHLISGTFHVSFVSTRPPFLFHSAFSLTPRLCISAHVCAQCGALARAAEAARRDGVAAPLSLEPFQPGARVCFCQDTLVFSSNISLNFNVCGADVSVCMLSDWWVIAMRELCALLSSQVPPPPPPPHNTNSTQTAHIHNPSTA
eukprot:COSAG06_NODE_4243_length_4437_cov_333.188797_6_plen_186_part_00